MSEHDGTAALMDSQQLWLPAQDLHAQASLHAGMYPRVAEDLLMASSEGDPVFFKGMTWQLHYTSVDGLTP